MTDIRLLSLWQPWASLIALKLKQYETRSWGTNYRGKIAIHAAKRKIDLHECNAIFSGEFPGNHTVWKAICEITASPHYGCIVAIADLAACSKMRLKSVSNPQLHEALLMGNDNIFIEEQTLLEQRVGDWKPDRYAWKLENVLALPNPISCKGAQGLRHLDEEIAVHIRSLTGGRK